MNFEWLDGVGPVVPEILHALAWVALVIWVLTRPAEQVLSGAPDSSRWRDLRLWILPLSAIQVALYFLF